MDKDNKEYLNSIEHLLSSENGDKDITEKQFQILEAAIKIFAEKGFEGSRTSEIAKEAEVAEGTIFRYYKNKKDLLMGLVAPLITRFLRPLILMSAQKIVLNKDNKPIEQVLQTLFRDRLDLVGANSDLIKTIFMEAVYHPELLQVIKSNLGDAVIPMLKKFIEDNIKKENFKDIETTTMVRTLMSLLLGYVVLTNMFPEFFKVEDQTIEVEKIVDIFLNGVGKNTDNI